LGFIGICLALAIAVNFASEVRQRMLPSYAQPSFIEAHFAEQLATLRRLALNGKEPNEKEKHLFDAVDIRGAFVISSYGENGCSARVVKECDQSAGINNGAWLPPKPRTDRPAITIWGDDRLQYEAQIRGPNETLAGYQLFLDLSSLKARDQTMRAAKDYGVQRTQY
jgi:hypothetical protein